MTIDIKITLAGEHNIKNLMGGYVPGRSGIAVEHTNYVPQYEDRFD